MKRLIKYVKPYYWQIAVAALASIGCSVANVRGIDILRQVIDLSLAGTVGDGLWELVISAGFVIGAGFLTNYLVVAMTGMFGAGILRDLRRDSLNHIMKTSPDFMERNNFGDMMERLSSDVESIAGYMQTYFKDCLYVPIVVVVFAGYLVTLNPMLAVWCLGPLVIMVPLSIRLLKPVKLAQAEYVKKLGLTNNNMKEAFDGVEVIKSYNLQKQMLEKYQKVLQETLDISNRNDARQYHIEPLSCLIREAPTAMALCVGGYLAFQGNVTLGILVAFISGIEKINEPLVGAYQLVVRTQMAMISVKRVFEIMDMPVEAVEETVTAMDTSGEEIFTLRNVSFTYAGQEGKVQKALENINLTIQKGKRIALIGASGCGKSTVLKLLCRQYEADEGEILFHGKRYSDLSPETVRAEIALISQDTILFPMSVLDNIRVGRPEATRAEIIHAARLAGCDGFIQKLPAGYDTRLEEKGGNLSGGQRQRISIARAILKEAPVLLLDEPTSALDEETEAYICQTLSEISKGKTVITVAHRLSTIADYDEVIRMEDGHVKEVWKDEGVSKIPFLYREV